MPSKMEIHRAATVEFSSYFDSDTNHGGKQEQGWDAEGIKIQTVEVHKLIRSFQSSLH